MLVDVQRHMVTGSSTTPSVVVEVYPVAALKQWGLTYRGYKGTPTPPSATNLSTR